MLRLSFPLGSPYNATPAPLPLTPPVMLCSLSLCTCVQRPVRNFCLVAATIAALSPSSHPVMATSSSSSTSSSHPVMATSSLALITPIHRTAGLQGQDVDFHDWSQEQCLSPCTHQDVGIDPNEKPPCVLPCLSDAAGHC